MYTYLSCMYAQSVNHSIFLFAHTHVDAREHTAWLQDQAEGRSSRHSKL